MRVLQGELVVPWVEGLDRLEERPTMEEVLPPRHPPPRGRPATAPRRAWGCGRCGRGGGPGCQGAGWRYYSGMDR